jgi:hypothetical protein
MRFFYVSVVIGFAMMLSPTQAQSQNWQEYRPNDIGFRIEMPDKPVLQIQEINGRPAYSAVVGIDKSVGGTDLVFLVKYQEANKKPGAEPEEILDTVIKALAAGGKLLNMKKEVLGGYPARRLAFEDTEKDRYESRSIVTDRHFIQVIFMGPPDNPLGKRFLDSFDIVTP